MMMPLLLFVDSQCVFMWIYGFLKAFELVNFMDLFIVSVNFGVCFQNFGWCFPFKLKLSYGVWERHFFLEGNIVAFTWRIWSVPQMLW